MTFKSILIITALIPLFTIVSCKEKSELGDLSPSSNVFAPENHTVFFEVDSVERNNYPYIQLYYHVRYDLIPDSSLISKIIIFRDGELKFRMSPTQSNVLHPRDFDVSHGAGYYYSFAFEEKDGTLSSFSEPYYVYFP